MAKPKTPEDFQNLADDRLLYLARSLSPEKFEISLPVGSPGRQEFDRAVSRREERIKRALNAPIPAGWKLPWAKDKQ